MTKSNTDTPQPSEEQKPRIDDKFQAVFPAKTLEEHRALMEDIRERGILDKLIVWEQTGIILDGHNRFLIHEELGLDKPLEYQKLPFPDEKSAKMWMLQHQIIRRNLKTFQRVEAVLNLNDYYAEMAKENMKTAGKPLTQKLGEGGEVNEALGKLVNTSAETIRKIKKILDNENDKEVAKGIEALRKGDPNVSIHSVYLKCPSENAGKPDLQPPSRGLEKKINDALNGFDDIAEQFSEKETDHIYVFDMIIKWAQGKRR